VLRVYHDILVFFDDIDDVQLDTELFGNPERIITFFPLAIAITNGMRVPFHAKAGKEVDAFYLDTLLLNQSGRQ